MDNYRKLDFFAAALEDGVMKRYGMITFPQLCGIIGIADVYSFNIFLFETFGYSGAEIMDIYR